MTQDDNRAVAMEYGVILFLTVCIFVLDVLTPLGWAVWILYLIPLLLTVATPHERAPIYFSILCTLLMIVGFMSSPPGIPRHIALFNSATGLCAMWAFAFGMVGRRRAYEGMLAAAKNRHRAEEKTAVRALRLEGILQSAMDAIVTVGDEQKIVLFNQAAERMFQCKAEEAIGRPIDRFIPERFRGAHHGHIAAFGQSGVTNRRIESLGVITGLRANGEEFPAEAAISQIGIDGGKYFTVVLRDVTGRHRAELALKESEARFKAFMDHSPAVASLKDTLGHYVYVNRPFERRLNKPSADVLGKTDFDIWPPAVAHQLHDNDALVLVTNAPVEKVETMPGLEGEVEQWLAFKFPVSDASGARYVGGMAVDISERKKLEEQLRRTERVAELGTLATGMAHEIGTPMSVILGRAEYLMERVKDEPTKKGLKTIVSQVERITKVMNQLLTFARRRPPERRAVDLRRTIEDNLEIFHERLERHRIKVEKTFAEACPLVYADADQMSQVAINLVMNAVHAMPEGGTLRIGLAPSDGMVKLTVADTGHGIPQEVIAKIFDPFFTTKEFGKGTGLGLTVVKGIMEEHGGSVSVDSEPGNGTTFTVTLPINQHEGQG